MMPTPYPLAVGNAVQVGLMALSGYFDPCEHCGVMFQTDPVSEQAVPDWLVTGIQYRPHDRAYPWHVEGVNLNVEPGEYGHRFSWSVPDLSWRFGWAA